MAKPTLSKDDLDMIGIEDEKESKIKVAIADAPGAETPFESPYHRVSDRYKKKKITAPLGLSEQLPPPITRRRIAIYQAQGLHEIDPLCGEQVLDQSISIAGSYVIYDEFEQDLARRSKRLRNVTGVHSEIRDRKEEMVETVSDIFFNNGFLAVNCLANYPLYTFVELHPLNGSNRRRPNVPAAFRRVDLSTPSVSMRAAQMDLAFEAESQVLKMAKDVLFDYAASFGITTSNRKIDEIRYDMRVHARQHPKEFFAMAKDSTAAIKMNVVDADSMGLIEYNLDRKGWVFCDNIHKPFMVTTPGEDATDALVKFFEKKTKDSQDAYERMLELLKYWEQ